MAWDRDAREVTEAGEYAGERRLAIRATQLGLPASRARRIVDGWVELFQAGPTEIEQLEFRSRTPTRLFAALRAQTQLRALTLQWGDYSDLGVLSGMRDLASLALGGAVKVDTVEPLAGLPGLRDLEIQGAKRLRDYAPIGRIAELERLRLVGSHGQSCAVESIAFLRELRSLRELVLSIGVADLDYSPLLDLQWAQRLWVWETRGMHPSLLDLEWAVPGILADRRARAAETAAHDASFVPTGLGQERLTTAAELRLLDDIERAWVELLDGRRTRVDVLSWARAAQSVANGDLASAGLWALQRSLLGQPWDAPPDREVLALFRQLEDWRVEVTEFRRDPRGERRREAMRQVRLLLTPGLNPMAWAMLAPLLDDGVLNDEDLIALGLDPADRPGGPEDGTSEG